MTAWVFHHSQLQDALQAFMQAKAGEDGSNAVNYRQLVLDFLLSDQASGLRMQTPDVKSNAVVEAGSVTPRTDG